MKQYKIFVNPQGTCEAVKQGWSWPAFLFTWVWGIFKKMWWPFVCVLISVFVLAPFIAAFADVVTIVISVIFGIYGNEWRENNLPTRGYDYKESVTAANPEGAIALYMKEKKNNSLGENS